MNKVWHTHTLSYHLSTRLGRVGGGVVTAVIHKRCYRHLLSNFHDGWMTKMKYEIRKTLFGRFLVYELAPYGDKDGTWIATFKRIYDAEMFVLGQTASRDFRIL